MSWFYRREKTKKRKSNNIKRNLFTSVDICISPKKRRRKSPNILIRTSEIVHFQAHAFYISKRTWSKTYQKNSTLHYFIHIPTKQKCSYQLPSESRYQGFQESSNGLLSISKWLGHRGNLSVTVKSMKLGELSSLLNIWS